MLFETGMSVAAVERRRFPVGASPTRQPLRLIMIMYRRHSAFPKTVEINADQMQRIGDFLSAIGRPLQTDTIKTGWTNKYAAQAVAAVEQSK